MTNTRAVMDAFANNGPLPALEKTAGLQAGHAPFVSVDGVSMRFSIKGSDVLALSDISMAMPRGSFTSIIGPSGCGKSTLLRLVADILKPSAGTISIDGSPPGSARADRRIGFVFQEATLLPWRTVLENISLPLEVVGQKPGRGIYSPKSLLELVGLDGFANARPDQLSGGMQQRVAIARALVLQPDVLLLDEPFGALDEMTRQKLNLELLRIWDETRTTAMLVTHSLSEAVFMSDTVFVMSARPGRLVETISVDLPRPRSEEHLRLQRFVQLVNDVRDALAVGEARS